MEIYNVYSENRMNSLRESPPPALSEERDPTAKAPDIPEEQNSLPVVYKRYDPRRKDYIVNLSSGDVRVSAWEEPVLQGVFEMDSDEADGMKHRFSSWTKTIGSILGRGIKKGVYIDRVV